MNDTESEEDSGDEQNKIDCSKSASEERLIHEFDIAHPQYQTHGLRKRKKRQWPRYTAKRLPNVLNLQDNSNLNVTERDSLREVYAQGALLMFHPFRQLSGTIRVISNN